MCLIISDYGELEECLNQVMVEYDLTPREMISALDKYSEELKGKLDSIESA